MLTAAPMSALALLLVLAIRELPLAASGGYDHPAGPGGPADQRALMTASRRIVASSEPDTRSPQPRPNHPDQQEKNVTKVFFDISMSLDGYMTASGQTPEEPMGPGGDQLVAWAFGEDERDRQVLLEGVAGTGAVIAGRRTYDTSLPWWGVDGPTGNARVPVFVVTHDPPADAPQGGVYTFVMGGIELALEQAKAAAGDKDVTVMGGADTGHQYLRAGLIDELSIHLVPILLGGGTRTFEPLGDEPIIKLEHNGITGTAAATHLRLRVVK